MVFWLCTRVEDLIFDFVENFVEIFVDFDFVKNCLCLFEQSHFIRLFVLCIRVKDDGSLNAAQMEVKTNMYFWEPFHAIFQIRYCFNLKFA